MMRDSGGPEGRPTGLTRKQFIGRLAATSAALPVVPALLGASKPPSARLTGTLNMYGILTVTPGHGVTKLLNDFLKQHPGLKINYQSFTSEQFVALFTAAQQSGQEIDVLMLNGQDVRRYATNGDLLPLDHIRYKDRFQKLAIDTYTIRGHLWGVPLASTGGFNIMTNKYLLDKVGASYPKTYAELVAAGKKLQKIGVSAFSHPGKVIYLWPVWFFTTYAQTTHNQSLQKTIATLRGKGKFTDPEVVQALDLIFRFSKDGLFSPDVLSLDTNGTEHEFLTGKAAFSMGDYGFSSTLRQQKVPNMNLTAQLMPRLVADPSVKSQFPGGPGIPLCLYYKIPPAHESAAYALLDYMSTNASDQYLVQDAQATLGVNNGVTGSTSRLARQEGAELPNMTVYLDWFWPPEINHAFQEGIQAGVAGSQSARQVAQSIQSVFDGLVAKGYKFQS
jgi:raffinose/stachyose/melibiose transport system substrate-binding protein